MTIARGSARRRWLWLAGVLACGSCASGCRVGEDVPVGVCGNYVLEGTAEECDLPDAGDCPTTGTNACRWTCNRNADLGTVGVCRDSTMRCGLDGVCRRPKGDLVGPTTIGSPGDRVELVSLKGDGYPDLALRSRTTISLYTNDAACTDGTCGRLARTFARARTVASARPDTVETAVGLVPVPSDDATNPLFVAADKAGLHFYTYGDLAPPGGLATLVVPSTRLPTTGSPSIASPSLVGTVTFDPARAAVPIFAENAGAAYGRLYAFDQNRAVYTGATFDWSACGMTLEAPADSQGQAQGKAGPPPPFVVDINALSLGFDAASGLPRTEASTLVGLWRGKDSNATMPSLCVVFAAGASSGAQADRFVEPQPLVVPPGLNGTNVGNPVLGFVDEDARLDVIVPFADPSGRNRLAVWLQTQPHRFAPPRVLDVIVDSTVRLAPYNQMSGPVVATVVPSVRAVQVVPRASLTDYRTDLVHPGGVLENTGLTGTPWIEHSTPSDGSIDGVMAADVNHDTFIDWIGLRPSLGQVVTCIGNGTGIRYAQSTTDVGLVQLSGGLSGAGRAGTQPPLVADFDGDGTNDVLVADPGGVARSGSTWSSPGRLALVQGQPYHWPSTTPVLVSAFQSRIGGVAPLPPLADRAATDTLVMLVAQDATGKPADYHVTTQLPALAALQFDSSGAVSTALPGEFAQVLGGDLYGDAHDDLAVLEVPTAAGAGPSVRLYVGQNDAYFLGAPLTFAATGLPTGARYQLLRAGHQQPAPVAVLALAQGVATIVRFAGPAPTTTPPTVWSSPKALLVQQARAVDVDADGIDEVLVTGATFDSRGVQHTEVRLVRLPASGGVVGGDVVAATFYQPGTHAFALAEAPGLDGRFDGYLDLVLVALGGDLRARRVDQESSAYPYDPTTHTYSAQPVSFHLPALDTVAVLDSSSIGLPPDVWVATVDLNGDGVRDLLFDGERGAFVLYGQVERP